MDRDRSLADGRDLLESWIHEVLQQTGIELMPYQLKILESYLSNRNSPSNHVGSENETSQAREMGDGIRS